MERNFTNENFEGFLRQNADGLRMRPSGRVWKGISEHLNRRKRRIGYALGITLLLTTALGYYLINDSVQQPSKALNTPQANQKPSERSHAQPGLNNNEHRSIEEPLAFLPPVQGKNKMEQAATIALYEQPFSFAQNLVSEQSPASFIGNSFVPTVVDSNPENENYQEKNNSDLAQVPVVDPQTIESIINSYKARRKSKLGTQIYFTPTVSYRKLNDNTIDKIVTHKPDFGFELGVSAKYPVSKNVKLVSGIQFNVNRYGIRTYSSVSQMATIKVIDGRRVGYVNTVTNYNNFSGYKSNWLDNFYFQVSAPTGAEFSIKGDDKMQFGIATTIQPTYVIGDKAYLISSDYKNYAEVPNLVRRWNVSGNLGTYVSYSTGHLKWQVGPQVRYQFLSSYLKKYPVKENLFDFGLRIGIGLNNQ